MTWTFGTSTDSNTSNVKKTCWMTVAIIISILIFIFIINDFFMKKKEVRDPRDPREQREHKQPRNVKFYDDDYDEQEDNKIMKKNRCSV